MPPNHQEPSFPESRAERVLARYLERRAAGEEVSVETLCGENPSIAGKLRDLLPLMDAVLGELRDSFVVRSSYAPHLHNDADPVVTLDSPPPSDGSGLSSQQILARLARHTPPESRYRILEEVGRGGMGIVSRVWDEDLRRTLAMKVIRAFQANSNTSKLSPSEARSLGRFFEEAQITGQLDHPGIVPVHELGVDAQGRVYFTMRLVRGRNLGQVLDLMHSGSPDWSQTRVLNVLLRACESVAYAHSKGVLHRDLKPANIMVGDFGEVYVMDWGLARVRGTPERHDLRLSSESARADSDDDSGLPQIITVEGQVIGTPAYMSPEQALGALEQIDERADVYSLGAVLYQLLAGQPPHVGRGERVDPQALLARVIAGPPQSLLELAPATPVELQAICDKAMRRDRQRRYGDVEALAADLRAFLEHRVVQAYQTGALAELRKWVERNWALSSAIGAAVLAVIVGAAAFAFKAAEADENAATARSNEHQATINEQRALAGERGAKRNEAIADEERKRAEARADEVLRLSALQDLQDLETEAIFLWPASPRIVPKYEAWIAKAQSLVDRIPVHEKNLAALGARSHPRQQEDAVPRGTSDPGTIKEHSTAPPESTWQFDTIEDRWWHNQLLKLVDGLKALADPKSGLLSEHVSAEHGWGVKKRLAFASTILERSVSGPDASARWAEALASIRDPAQCPRYAGLALSPQIGLLPLERNPASGLWEFAHLQSGESPERGSDGKLVLKEETSLVLVLIPNGTFWMGAQKQDPNGQNYDPLANVDESPVHEVALTAYFLSKYEMTQGQWKRLSGINPSNYGPDGIWGPDWVEGGAPSNLMHPVESISWSDCMEVLQHAMLTLPSEAQWEYGARGATQTSWWSGDDPATCAEAGNVADTYHRDHGGPSGIVVESWSDGFSTHAPIGRFRASSFGLHDVVGNVWELCRDGYDVAYYGRGPVRNPVAPEDPSRTVARGGSFANVASSARSAVREYFSFAPNIGVRPARTVDP